MSSQSDGALPAELADLSREDLADRWIVSRYYKTVQTVTEGLGKYRLHDAISCIYDFFWHDYCDWYLELIKRRVGSEATSESRKVPMQIAVSVMEGCMRLLHPFMPFITEEIWQSLDGRQADSIMISPWPLVDESAFDPAAEADMKVLQECINAIRNIRGEMNIPPRKKVNVVFKPRDERIANLLEGCRSYIADCAVTDEMSVSSDSTVPTPAARAFPAGAEVHVPLAGLIDVDKERNRLEKALGKAESEIAAHDGKLSNDKFLSNAPDHVIENTRKRREELAQKVEKIKESLSQLG